MDSFDKKIISGIIIVVVFTVSLYAFLLFVSNDSNDTQSLDQDTIEKCRTLTRQSADILVQTAIVSQTNANKNNYNDSGSNNNDNKLENTKKLEELKIHALDIEKNMSDLKCHETQEEWAYGSFKQEMSEYEAYIAEIVRQNTK